MRPLLSPFTTCMLSHLFCQMEWQMCWSRVFSGFFYTPIKPHRVSQAKWFPFQTRIGSRKKWKIWNKNHQPGAILRIRKLFVSHFSHLLRHAIEKDLGTILWTLKFRGPMGLKAFENIVGKREMLVTSIFSFPQFFAII